MKKESLSLRFWKHVRCGEECWEWLGSKNQHGYGCIRLTGTRKLARAHRVSWELHFSPIPHGKQVLHSCDNPSCVNPAHLFLGTHSDNMRDMARKDRAWSGERPRGDRHPFSKLTRAFVEQARVEHASGKRIIDISREHHVPYNRLWNAIRGVSWK